jgi:hypothetical protein
VTIDPEIYRKARALIEDPEHWTTSVFARDADDNVVGFESPEATKFCAHGAVIRVAFDAGLDHSQQNAYEWLLSDAAKAIDDKFSSPSRINDRGGHEGALKLLDKAIELAEAAS